MKIWPAKTTMGIFAGALALASLGIAPLATAGEVEIVDVQVNARGGDSFNFSVTLRHADAGWDHYANKWDVRTIDGTVLGTRALAHPHVN
ncbi:MAG: hypothetical protein ACTSUY_08730, partial [Alphaproteobacteria bacterium]